MMSAVGVTSRLDRRLVLATILATGLGRVDILGLTTAEGRFIVEVDSSSSADMDPEYSPPSSLPSHS